LQWLRSIEQELMQFMPAMLGGGEYL